MNYLVLAVWEGEDSPFTLSREMHILNEPEDEPQKIISYMANEGIGRERLWEIFVFKSAQNYGSAPEQVAYWNQEDGLFGPEDAYEDDQG
jgi:hypothetical protein